MSKSEGQWARSEGLELAAPPALAPTTADPLNLQRVGQGRWATVCPTHWSLPFLSALLNLSHSITHLIPPPTLDRLPGLWVDLCQTRAGRRSCG